MDNTMSDTSTDDTTNVGSEDAELQLKKDAELAAYIMIENEGAELAKLRDEDKRLVAAGLAAKLEKASHEQGLDVAELRHKLELSQEQKREDAYEM
jgi:hypothetical protein